MPDELEELEELDDDDEEVEILARARFVGVLVFALALAAARGVTKSLAPIPW